MAYDDLNFLQDDDKIVTHKESKLQFKANRVLFGSITLNNELYYIDKAGDCFRIVIHHNKNGTGDHISTTFIFGLLSQPTEFSFVQNKISAMDSFNRKFTYSERGQLESVEFNQ